MSWFAPSGRMRGWVGALVFLALSGFLLQPTCAAWWARGDRSQVAAAAGGHGQRTVQEGAHQHSGPDECCVIEAVADHVSPLPSVAIWHERSTGAGVALPQPGHGKIAFPTHVSSGVAYHPPDRGTPYHARSARLLL
jgi:hypothetical protein